MKKIVLHSTILSTICINAYTIDIYLINAMQDNNEELALAIAASSADNSFYNNPSVIAAVENLRGYNDDDIKAFKNKVEAKKKAGAGIDLEKTKNEIENLIKDNKLPVKKVNNLLDAKNQLQQFFNKDQVGGQLLNAIGATEQQINSIQQNIKAIDVKKSPLK